MGEFNTQDYLDEQKSKGYALADILLKEFDEDICKDFFKEYFTIFDYMEGHIGYLFSGIEDYTTYLHSNAIDNLDLSSLNRDLLEGRLVKLEEMLSKLSKLSDDNIFYEDLTQEQVEDLNLINILSEIKDKYTLDGKEINNDCAYYTVIYNKEDVKVPELYNYQTIMSVLQSLYYNKIYGDEFYIDLQSDTYGFSMALENTLTKHSLIDLYKECKHKLEDWIQGEYFGYRIENYFISYLLKNKDLYYIKYTGKDK